MVSLLYDSATEQRTVFVQDLKSNYALCMSTYRRHVRIFLPICQNEKKISMTALTIWSEKHWNIFVVQIEIKKKYKMVKEPFISSILSVCDVGPTYSFYF